ncbi:MAG: hypothetical protein R2845_02580 [Thermomicrobiales bacterium]
MLLDRVVQRLSRQWTAHDLGGRVAIITDLPRLGDHSGRQIGLAQQFLDQPFAE